MGLHHLEARAEARMRDDLPPAASLLAEVERLRREIAVARARIGELEARADIDPLLDILNRRGFERELKRALAYVNRYGTGDALLKALSQQLSAHVRASDIVGRLGGDELGVVLWRIDETQASAK